MKEGMFPHKAIYNIFLLIASLVFTLSNSNHFFFWDTITEVSIPANWYFDNSFSHLLIPDEIASGHPPFAGMYLALIWKIFGRSLIVSHFAIFPFVFGILFQLNRYIERSDYTKKISWFIFLIVILDATFISQMSLITFDVIQIFFYLWCINCIIERKPVRLALSFILLSMTSMRGIICAGGILLFHLLYEYINGRKITFKTIFPYIPGVIFILVFGIFYLANHWILKNGVFGIGQQTFENPTLKSLLTNIAITGWRIIDYGRIGIWIVLGYIIVIALKRKTLFDSFFRDTLLIAVSQFIFFIPVLVFFVRFIGHRYLLPAYLFVAVCCIYWVLKYSRKPVLIYILVLVCLVSGYSWIYPQTIAQGWDATPAHWPYYKLRNEMLRIIEKDSLQTEKIGTFFPNLASFRTIDLSNKETSFKEADLSSDRYILFSNVFNIPDDKINDLYISGNWEIFEKVERRGVNLILFRRKE